MKKQLLTTVLAGALLFSMTACGGIESEQSDTGSLAGQTFTGTVSAISAEELSLEIRTNGPYGTGNARCNRVFSGDTHEKRR